MRSKAFLYFAPPCLVWAALALLQSNATSHQHSRAPAPTALITQRIYAQIPHQSLETFARRADGIGYGLILGQEPEFLDGDEAYTRITAAMSYAIKGDLPATVTFRVPGARTSDRVAVCDASPSFQDRQEVVLFLQRGSDRESWGLLGLSQGAYRVSPGKDGALVVNGLHAQDEPLGDFESRVADFNR